MHHERLVNEATFTAAERLLDSLPADQRRTLEGPVHEAIATHIPLNHVIPRGGPTAQDYCRRFSSRGDHEQFGHGIE